MLLKGERDRRINFKQGSELGGNEKLNVIKRVRYRETVIKLDDNRTTSRLAIESSRSNILASPLQIDFNHSCSWLLSGCLESLGTRQLERHVPNLMYRILSPEVGRP